MENSKPETKNSPKKAPKGHTKRLDNKPHNKGKKKFKKAPMPVFITQNYNYNPTPTIKCRDTGEDVVLDKWTNVSSSGKMYNIWGEEIKIIHKTPEEIEAMMEDKKEEPLPEDPKPVIEKLEKSLRRQRKEKKPRKVDESMITWDHLG
ncbi:MAG: hypothetical protein KDH96_05745 [Candidatus Riesia sp.]|nr:hypothetical protein [Candidatus Riesia sp.]